MAEIDHKEITNVPIALYIKNSSSCLMDWPGCGTYKKEHSYSIADLGAGGG